MKFIRSKEAVTSCLLRKSFVLVNLMCTSSAICSTRFDIWGYILFLCSALKARDLY